MRRATATRVGPESAPARRAASRPYKLSWRMGSLSRSLACEIEQAQARASVPVTSPSSPAPATPCFLFQPAREMTKGLPSTHFNARTATLLHVHYTFTCTGTHALKCIRSKASRCVNENESTDRCGKPRKIAQRLPITSKPGSLASSWEVHGRTAATKTSTASCVTNCSTVRIFFSLKEAQLVIENWRRHYNTARPHSSREHKRRHPRPSSGQHQSAQALN